MLHYDPNDIDKPHPLPLYINAEWYLMRANVLGRDLEYEMMNPILVTRNMSR